MLFMGNNKIKDSLEFFNYINFNGGITNANTSTINTSFYYTINPAKLQESVNIFVEFFKSPSFNDESINAEINNINSEYIKDIDINIFKYYELLKQNYSYASKFNKFDIGNKKTLQIPNIKEKLIEFFNKYYNPENMKLIVFDNDEIDNIYKKIKIFETLISKNNGFVNNKVLIPKHPFNKNKVIKIVNKNKYSECILFYAIKKEDFNISIFNYISYLICKKSKNGIYTLLHNNNFINNIQINILQNLKEYYIIYIFIDILDNGMNNIDILLSILNQYISKFKDNFNKENYNKYLNCIKLNYLYNDSHIYNIEIENKIQIVMFNNNIIGDNLENVLFTNEKHYNYNENILKKYFTILDELSVENSCIVLNSYRNVIINEKVEKYFNIKYEISDNNYLLKNIKFDFKDVYYFNEKFNNYNYEKILIKNKIIEITNQYLIQPNKDIKLFISSSLSIIPKTTVILLFEIPEYKDIKTFILSQILFIAIKHLLYTELYEFTLCGGKFELKINKNKIYILLEAFNYNIVMLMKIIFEYIVNTKLNETLFKTAKNKFKLQLEKKLNENLLFKLNMLLFKIFYKYAYEIDALENINNVTFNDLIGVKFNINNIKALIYGNNFNVNQKIYETIIHYNKMNMNNNNLWALNEIINNKEYIFTINNSNNILFNVSVIIKCNKHSDDYFKYQIYNYIIRKSLKYKFFDEFRTKRQLGYIVRNEIMTIGDIDLLFIHNFYIQLNDINKIDKIDIDLFFRNINLTNEEINKWKDNLIKKYTKKYVSHYNLAKDKFKDINEECLGLNEKMIEIIKGLNIGDLIGWYRNYFVRNCVKNYIIIKNS